MQLLALFSGTKYVGKVAEQLGYEVISLDLKDADINCDILDWDYTIYPVGHFNVIWASPPCDTFSRMKFCQIGRNGRTMESIQQDINNTGLPILRRTEEIIKYVEPEYYFIENPQTGKMKDYIEDKPYHDVDYCKYADWGYQKRTRIWTNIEGFNPLVCRRDCNNLIGKRHKTRIGTIERIAYDGKIIDVNTKELRIKHKDVPRLSEFNTTTNLKDRHKIPPALVEELFNCMVI